MSARSTHSGVVVGVDGSPSSTMAVRWAAREATMRNIGLTVVHVSEPPAVWPAAPIPAVIYQRAPRRGPPARRRCDSGRRRQRAAGQSTRDRQRTVVRSAHTHPYRPVQRGAHGGGRVPRTRRAAADPARLGQHRIDPSRPLPGRGDPRRGPDPAGTLAVTGAGRH